MQHKSARIVAAAPAAPMDCCDELRQMVDEFVVIARPHPFYSVGQSYEVFDQTTDEEVQDLLKSSPGVQPQKR
jgi:predicted phosphoribosyltransferase